MEALSSTETNNHSYNENLEPGSMPRSCGFKILILPAG